MPEVNIIKNLRENDQDAKVINFVPVFQKTHARYIKNIAKNMGKCPKWHKGSGYKAWLFIDEFTME